MTAMLKTLSSLKNDLYGDYNGFIRLMGRYEAHLRTLNALQLTGESGNPEVHKMNVTVAKEVIRLRCGSALNISDRYKEELKLLNSQRLDGLDKLQFEDALHAFKVVLRAYDEEILRLEEITVG